MNYFGCSMIDQFFMNFNGRIDTGEKAITLCCENLDNIPGVAFAETPKDTLRLFVGERQLVLAEGLQRDRQKHCQPQFSVGCEACVRYRNEERNPAGLISYVNFSMYPAPCQCRCIYCTVHKEGLDCFKPEAKAAYEKLFETVELAKESGIIAPSAVWQVSSGEITIHPYRKRIMDLVQGQHAVFYTNCFKFDEDIAQNLQDNPNSAINLSIDAGTPATWKKIKGFDNFEEITSNLVQYYAACGRPGQISLKYIVLPGINDIYEDYLSLIEIMKVLEVKHLTLSRDSRTKYKQTQKERTELVSAAAYLVAMCHKNNIKNDMFAYSQEEQKQTVCLANEILQKGQI